MRVIITGGTGLIGSALVKSLADDGHTVHVLSRNPRQSGPMPDHVQYHKWDAKTADGWGHLVEESDAIVNLAGASIAGEGFLPSRWTEARKQAILQSRLNAGAAVVAAIDAAEHKPNVVIQSSAVGYYGTHKDKQFTENAAPGGDFLADVCIKWEDSTSDLEDMDVRRVIVRMGVVLSAKGGALTRMVFPFRLFAGGPLGSGKQALPWIHIADVVNAIRCLIEDPTAHGAFNLAAPAHDTNGSFTKTAGKVFKRPDFLPVPGFAFRMMFGEVASILLEGQFVSSDKLQAQGYPFAFADLEAALRDLYPKGL